MEEDPLSFFLHFCYKRIREEESGGGSEYDLVHIPQHTVVYEQHFPKQWLYYEGVRLYRKTGKDISDTGQIYKAFIEGTNEEDTEEVVAFFVCYSRDVDASTLKHTGWCDDDVFASAAAISVVTTVAQCDVADDTFKVAFFTRTTLRLFLQERARRTEKGVLIKFAQPRGKHVEYVKVHWTPHVSTVVHRVNKHLVAKREGGLYARHMAFKNLLHHVEQHNANRLLAEMLICVSNRFVRDLEAHHERVKVQEVTFFFQPLKTGDVAFVFCNHCVVRQRRPPCTSQQLTLRRRKTNLHDSVKAHSKDAILPAERRNNNDSTPPPDATKAIYRALRTATVSEKFEFFKTHVVPRYAGAMKGANVFSSSYVTDREEYLVQRFQLLHRDVATKQMRHKSHTAVGSKRGGMVEAQPRSLAQLAFNLMEKADPALEGALQESSVFAHLVDTVAGSRLAACAAAISVFEICVVLCNGNAKQLVGEPVTIEEMKTFRARALYVATQRERSCKAVNYVFEPDPNRVLTFTSVPKHAPSLKDRARCIKSKFDPQLSLPATDRGAEGGVGRALATFQHLHPDEAAVEGYRARTMHRARQAVEEHRAKMKIALKKSPDM